MQYFWIWIYLAGIVGAIVGFGVRHFLGPRKTEYTVNSVVGTVDWITNRPFKDAERITKDIVKLVFLDKRTIHKNPVRQKAAPAKYPVSER